MKNYLKNEFIYNNISFSLSDSPFFEEREIHSYHEILLCFSKNAELLTDNGCFILKENTLVVIPRESFHFFRLENSEDFLRLKISFSPNVLENTPLESVMSSLKIIETENTPLRYIIDKLYRLLKQSGENVPFYAYSAFLMLISELDILSDDDGQILSAERSQSMMNLTKYISSNLSKDLNINLLSEKLYISPSGIAHQFKKEFGISLHKYITQKRLVYAKKLIEEGNKATKIYTDAGFKDYSSFYKAYKNYFGNNPSCEKTKKRV